MSDHPHRTVHPAGPVFVVVVCVVSLIHLGNEFAQGHTLDPLQWAGLVLVPLFLIGSCTILAKEVVRPMKVCPACGMGPKGIESEGDHDVCQNCGWNSRDGSETDD